MRDRYDDIRDMELEYACGDGKSVVLSGIYEWMMNLPADDMKRNAGVVAQLIMKLGESSVNDRRCRHCNHNPVNFNCDYCGNTRNW